MSDIRINALATTATSSASDDYLAIDGNVNNTRKLSAYSPAFGGNLTFGTSASVLNGTTGSIGLTATGTNQNITLTPSGTGSVNISPVGTTNPIRIGINGNAATYGMLTFNNVLTAVGFLGLTAGGGTDTNLYFNVPTGGAYDFRVANTQVIKFDTSGNVTVSSTTDSSSTTTGAIIVSGGVGIAKKLYVGNNIVGSGSVTTGAPSGGTAGAWKLGIRVAATTTLDTTQYLQVDVGGTLYKVALVTS